MRRILTTATLLATAFALLATPAAQAQGANPEVEVASGPLRFEPAELTVTVGDTVDFAWTSGFHNVRSDDCGDNTDDDTSCYRNQAGEPFWSESQGSGSSFSFTFDEPGTFAYFCDIHSSPDGSTQNGTITVQAQDGEPEPPEEPLPPEPEPLDGTDPVAHALAWSARLADDSVTAALIGTTAAFADSLASGAGQADAPLLLNPADTLDDRVLAELTRLGVQNVTILGGEAAISAEVAQSLQDAGLTVERIAGPSRVETAVAVASSFLPQATTVVIARAFGEGTAGFADSLGAGAFGPALGYPTLLTDTGSLHPATAGYLETQPVEQVLIAGGTAAISDTVAAAIEALGVSVTRLAGPTRFSTAVALRDRLIFSQFDGVEVPQPLLIEGTADLSWSSGFAAAHHGAGGILLSAGDSVPGPTLNALLAGASPICGPLASLGAACDLARAAASIDFGAEYVAVMDSEQEVPPTDVDASGIAFVWPTGVDGAVCYQAETVGLSGSIAAAHVHQAPFGVDGDVVIDMSLAGTELPDSTHQLGCTTGVSQEILDGIATDPGGYYVNIHTEANPGGEIRGQLFDDGPGQATLTAELIGSEEVPGPGDPDASGHFTLYSTGVTDEICYAMQLTGLTPPATAAHIHAGAQGTAGDVVFPLTFRSDGRSWHCDRGLDATQVAAVMADPSAYYVNVHNETFPAGAVRGQLLQTQVG